MLCRAPVRSSSNVRASSRIATPRASNHLQKRHYAAEATEVREIGGVKFENVTAKLTAQQQFLYYMTIPQQILFKVNNKFFSSLPDTWHTAQAQSFKKAVDAVEAAVAKTDLKGKVAELVQRTKEADKDLTAARKLYLAIEDANVSGEVKERARDLLAAIEAWELGPQDASRQAKIAEAEKLLLTRKDREVRKQIEKTLDAPLLSDKWTPEEVKYVHTIVEQDQASIYDVWGTEVRGVLQGVSPAELRKTITEKKQKYTQADNATIAKYAQFDGPQFPQRVEALLGPTMAKRVLERLSQAKA
jgi:hypothetical protein